MGGRSAKGRTGWGAIRLRPVIMLTLFALGVLPLVAWTWLNMPMVLDKLEESARHETMAQLQAEYFALNGRVEGLKEALRNVARLPGSRDLVGYRGEVPIDVGKIEKRFVALMQRWFAERHEVLSLQLIDRTGRTRLLLERSAGGLLVPRPPDAAAAIGTAPEGLGRGQVEVGSILVSHSRGDDTASHLYTIDLLTPTVAPDGVPVGSVALRVNMSDFLGEYSSSYWLDADGRLLHRHQAAEEGHRHGPEGDGAGRAGRIFPGLAEQIAAAGGSGPLLWRAPDGGRKVAWLPISFNAGRPPSLWLGSPVDRSAIETWLAGFKTKVLVVIGAILLLVFLAASWLTAVAERRKNELLEGLEAIVTGGRPLRFDWRGIGEMEQLADDLNALARRYTELSLARQQAEEDLRRHNEELEELVDRRTAELYATNEQLSEEIEERCQTEAELRRHRDHLEELVQERVVQLAETNEQLELEMVRREKAQRALRDNEEWLRTVLDSVHAGIFLVDIEDNAIVFANPEAVRIMGAQSDADVRGTPCRVFFAEGAANCCPIIELGQRQDNAERILTRLDGSRIPVLKTVVPITFAGRRHLLESMVDISELRRITEENRALQGQLLQSQKLEAIGVLAGGVAHDFNNLLTIIQGFTELALTKLEADHPLRRNLAQIKEGSSRATNLVRQLLLFSRKQPIKLATLDGNEVVEQLLKMLRRLIGEDIVIRTDLQEGLWPVQADAGNLDQVLMNLAVNARDAMPEGGTLTIRTENRELQGAAARDFAESDGRCVVLSVADTGVGIEPAALAHIFEPFYTTKEVGKGTGLGLAVAYGIVKQHGGTIEVESRPGEGTVFTIFLPALVRQPDREEEKVDLAGLRGRAERILLVEDDPGVGQFVAEALDDHGYRVFAAGSVEQARELFAQEEGRFDLLFSDVVLPGLSGIQLVDELLAQGAAIPVLFCSGYTDQKSQWPAIVEKGYPFLQKPFTIHELLEAVVGVLRPTEA